MNLRNLIWIVGVCLAIGASLFFLGEQRSEKENSFAHAHGKTIHYRFQLRNTTNQPISNARFFVHAPLKQTGVQQCVAIETSHPHEIVTDILGNRVLRFSFDNFPPFASKTISIRANLKQIEAPLKTDGTDPERFAAAIPYEGEEFSAIRQRATELKAGNIHSTAANLYRWVADNIQYTGYAREAKGACRTFSSRQGDCTEFADLFVAMARSLGIPARRVSGYLARESRLLKPEDFHDWAEFYDHGVWRIADAQQKNFDAQYADYIAMKIYDYSPSIDTMSSFHRFYICDDGLEVKMGS